METSESFLSTKVDYTLTKNYSNKHGQHKQQQPGGHSEHSSWYKVHHIPKGMVNKTPQSGYDQQEENIEGMGVKSLLKVLSIQIMAESEGQLVKTKNKKPTMDSA